MLTLYLFGLLVGGVLLAISLAGADQGAGDSGIDGLDAGDNPVKFLSLRTITYFLFVFGGAGSAMSWWWKSAGALPIFLLSLIAGLGVAGVVAAAFAYLARTDSVIPRSATRATRGPRSSWRRGFRSSSERVTTARSDRVRPRRGDRLSRGEEHDDEVGAYPGRSTVPPLARPATVGGRGERGTR